MGCQQCPQPCAHGKQADDAEVGQGFVQHLPVMCVKINAQGLGAAAHVADAHGAGIGVAPDLAEGLHLHGAYKGNQGVGQGVDALGQKSHRKQQDDLRQNDELPPVHLFHVLEMAVHAFRRENAQQERQHRDEVPGTVPPLPVKQIGAEQDDVARLGIGKHLAPAEIGVGVLQAAGENNERGGQQGFRHLPGVFMENHDV